MNTQNIKILHVLKIDSVGGLEKTVYDLCQHQKYLYPVSVFCFYSSDFNYGHNSNQYFYSHNRFYLFKVIEYIQFVAASNPSVIHNHSGGIFIDLLNILLFKGKLVITHNHGCRIWKYLYYPSLIDHIRQKSAKIIAKYLIRISVSEHNLRHTLHYEGMARKDYIIYNGCNCNQTARIVKPSEIVVGYIGRFSREKKFDRFIDLVKYSMHNNIKFSVSGYGEYEQKLHNLIQEVGTERLVYLGKYKNFDEILKNTSILIHTSDYESFGLTILESILSGVPIIISNQLEVIPEFESCVHKVNLTSNKEVIDKIYEIFENLEYHVDKLIWFRGKYTELFSIERMNRVISAIYKENLLKL